MPCQQLSRNASWSEPIPSQVVRSSTQAKPGVDLTTFAGASTYAERLRDVVGRDLARFCIGDHRGLLSASTEETLCLPCQGAVPA